MLNNERIAKSVRNPAIKATTSRPDSKLMRLSRYNVNPRSEETIKKSGPILGMQRFLEEDGHADLVPKTDKIQSRRQLVADLTQSLLRAIGQDMCQEVAGSVTI